jgi:hypothetical protein
VPYSSHDSFYLTLSISFFLFSHVLAFLQGEHVFVAEDTAVDVGDYMPDVAALRSLAVAQKDIVILGALGEGT